MFLDSMRFNFVDYLKDSKNGILTSTQKSLKWSSTYDFVSNLSSNNLNSTKIQDENQFYLSQPSQELDYDPEEYLFNLNISSGSLHEPAAKSARSTMNLFAKDNYEHESIEYDSSSLNNSDEAKKNKVRTKTISKQNITRNKKSKSNEEILRNSKKNTPSRAKRSTRRNRASANDFYILSFDNELSETSSDSSSSQSSLDEAVHDQDDDEDLNEDDDDQTATSVSSSMTINNDSGSFSSSHNNKSSSTNSSDPLMNQHRQLIIEYLFSNEENNKLYLNSNLNNFLGALDSFFENTNEIKDSSNNTELNLLCDQILSVYNELFVNPITQETKPSETLDKQVVLAHNLTTFPTFINESSNSSNSSINTNNQTFDSGVESTNSTSKENDIGPFLCALLNRLDHMLTNSLQINFLITGIFARLACYPQLVIRSFLLNHNLVLQPNIKSLIQVFLSFV